MSWTCPECGQTFLRTKQVHTCESYSLEHHFRNKGEEILSLYEYLIAQIRKFGSFDIRINKSEIVLRRGATFMGIRVSSARLDLLFFLDHCDPDPPVRRTTDVSRNRIIHEVIIKEKEQIDDRLLFLLFQSYTLLGQ